MQIARLPDEVRSHGMARVVNTRMPGVAGFCAPLKASAHPLSSDLGYLAA